MQWGRLRRAMTLRLGGDAAAAIGPQDAAASGITWPAAGVAVGGGTCRWGGRWWRLGTAEAG